MSDELYEYNTQKRKPKAKSKKVDRSRHKENKHKNNKVPVDINDFEDEILEIQGLTKCKGCGTPYPRVLNDCPYCDKRV